jgi:hypothetical protein
VTKVLPNAEVAIRNIKYQYQDSGIADTQCMWILLNNLSMTDERDPRPLIHFPDILAINYTTLKLGKEVDKSSGWTFPYGTSVMS